MYWLLLFQTTETHVDHSYNMKERDMPKFSIPSSVCAVPTTLSIRDYAEHTNMLYITPGKQLEPRSAG